MYKFSNVFLKFSSLSKEEDKINYLLSLLKNEEIVLEEDSIKIIHTYNILNYTRLSKQIISHNGFSSLSNTEKQIYEQIEHELVLKKIIDAINKIVIKENKLIFVEKYIYRYSNEKIIKIHYLSTSGFYLRIHDAEKQFLENLKN